MPAISHTVNGASANGTDVMAKKSKMSKNQMRRAKKKGDKARERASRETSAVTDSESDQEEVCLFV